MYTLPSATSWAFILRSAAFTSSSLMEETGSALALSRKSWISWSPTCEERSPEAAGKPAPGSRSCRSYLFVQAPSLGVGAVLQLRRLPCGFLKLLQLLRLLSGHGDHRRGEARHLSYVDPEALVAHACNGQDRRR